MSTAANPVRKSGEVLNPEFAQSAKGTHPCRKTAGHYISNGAKIGAAGLIALGGLGLFALFAGAANSPLAATCSGSAAQNVITWSASPTGGVPPYGFAWSGTGVNGASSSVMATYNATGTFEAMVQVSDSASSTATATSTCFASVASLPAPLPVISSVFVANASSTSALLTWTTNVPTTSEAHYSTSTPVDLSTAATAADANLTASHSLTLSGLAPGTTYFFVLRSVDAQGNMATTTQSSFATTAAPVPPSPEPSVEPGALAINPDGSFTANGMVVTSVGSSSFTGQIWGVAYAVNFSSVSLVPQGDDDGGNGLPALSPSQIHAGDLVEVAGQIDPSGPFTVDASRVRDFTAEGQTPPVLKSGDNDGDNAGVQNGNQLNDENSEGNAVTPPPLNTPAINTPAAVNALFRFANGGEGNSRGNGRGHGKNHGG